MRSFGSEMSKGKSLELSLLTSLKRHGADEPKCLVIIIGVGLPRILLEGGHIDRRFLNQFGVILVGVQKGVAATDSELPLAVTDRHSGTRLEKGKNK